MEFARAQKLQAIEPIVGFAVTLGLAIAGAGYWALVAGALAGAWTAAIAVTARSPYPLRWRYSKGALKVYKSYSWPLFLTSAATIVLANAGTLSLNARLGLAGVGVAALAATITQFTTRVDDIVSGTLYPAICATQDRLDLLRESFEKCNRLALIWAMPFGVGIALFCADLVHFGIGDRWRPAIGLLQITGVVAAIGHIGFNWDDYFRATAKTKPIAVATIAPMVSFLVVGVPLTLAYGLRGLAIGIGVQALVALAARAFYLSQLFSGFAFIRHASRAILPTLPAVAVVLLLRGVESGARSLLIAIAELVAYLLVTAGATLLVERRLLSEAVGYVVERRKAGVAST
jgi:PST family polysaccharide transporter